MKDMFIKIANSINNEDQQALAKIIIENDISPYKSILINGFLITFDNVCAHLEAAKKLAAFEVVDSLRDSMRINLLSELIEKVEQTPFEKKLDDILSKYQVDEKKDKVQ